MDDDARELRRGYRLARRAARPCARGFTTGLAATTTVVEAVRGRLIGVRRA